MQALHVQFEAEAGLVAGDTANVYVGIDPTTGKPAAIDYTKPATAKPVPVLAGVAEHPGRLGAARGRVNRKSPHYRAGRPTSRRVGRGGRHTVTVRTGTQAYFGQYTVAARPISRGGDEQTAGTVTKTLVVTSAPQAPTDAKVTGYDAGADQVTIGFGASPQLG